MVRTLRPTRYSYNFFLSRVTVSAESVQLRALSVKCSHWVSSQALANSLETNASSGSGHCSKADIGPGIESHLIRVHSVIALISV